jgi:hypothetical protein
MHNKQLIIVCGVLFLALVVLIASRGTITKEDELIACTADALMCPDGSSVGRTSPSCEFAPCPPAPEVQEDPVINVYAPKSNEVVTSPIVITGKARGTWFYEGSFLVYLLDPKGQIFAETTAIAQGDWMTEGFVPFTATISYIPQPGSSYDHGTIVVMRNNPSGLPENNDKREIPIQFGDLKATELP